MKNYFAFLWYVCLVNMLFIPLFQVHRISQLISESPEPKRSSIHHIPISCESPTEKRQTATLHTPVPAPPADDMKPQNISFIGNWILHTCFAILFCIVIYDIYIILRVIIMGKLKYSWKCFSFFRIIRTFLRSYFFIWRQWRWNCAWHSRLEHHIGQSYI
jgi:hypothetical protein